MNTEAHTLAYAKVNSPTTQVVAPAAQRIQVQKERIWLALQVLNCSL